MSGPPPPPPPGPPPPPAFFPPPVASAKGGDGRNQLLADIRKGTGLKKVATNDRSAPVIEAKSNGKSGGGQMNGGPPGLAGLFAGGMPKLKPAGGGAGKGTALMPPGRRVPSQDDASEGNVSSQSYPSSPQVKSKSTIPPGFGTVRKGFQYEAKAQAPPPPPPSNMKPNGRSGPPLPNKPPNVPAGKLNINKAIPPALKPPPPPKSPGIMVGPPPALPSKPPSCRRHQSFNEYDVRQGGITRQNRPMVNIKVSPSSGSGSESSPPSSALPATPDTLNVRAPAFKNVSTPNLAAAVKFGPPPPPSREPPQQPPSQFHTMPAALKLGPAPPPPPNRTTPYNPKAPASRPPPPPPGCKQTFSPPNPPPPPPHRVNPPTAPPPPPQQPPPPSRVASAVGNNLPPPPPVRNSSARNSFSGSTLALAPNINNYNNNNNNNINNNSDETFQGRFYYMFLSVNSLPAPDPFTNSPKNYASKNAQGQSFRAPAPAVPGAGSNTQVQLGNKLWANPSSDC